MKLPKKLFRVGEKVDSAFGRYTNGEIKQIEKSEGKRKYTVEWGNGLTEILEGEKLRRRFGGQ